MNQLQGLANDHIRIKKEIAGLSLELDAVNQSIASLCDAVEDGQKTLTEKGLKVTVTYKQNRKLDIKAYNNIKNTLNIPDDYPIIKTKESLDEVVFKKLEKDHPEWLQYTKEFVKVTQAKTAVAVKLIEEDKL
mgnify:CR=1 FL=1|tara:strand:+ start:20893 stop:21291 length:399 start_codon:yes stop_codon:yes gene_type:complete